MNDDDTAIFLLVRGEAEIYRTINYSENSGKKVTSFIRKI